MKDIIPLKIYLISFSILLSIVLIHWCIWGISQQKFEDLSLNLLTEIVGMIITLFVVDRLIKKYEKDKWSELDKRIDKQLVGILIRIFNAIFNQLGKLPEFVDVKNSEKSSQDKIAKYSEILENCQMDNNNLERTLTDDYLNGWYIDFYLSLLDQTNTFLSDFKHRIDHDQSPLIIDLRENLIVISSNMKSNHLLRKQLKQLNAELSLNDVEELKKNLIELINTLKCLIMQLNNYD